MPKPIFRSLDSPAVNRCRIAFQSRLHLPDASPVFAALGSIVANHFKGYPVWLMLVGAPSTGKTVIVRACTRLPYCRQAPTAHNASAFLTYDSKRGKGGLLAPCREDAEGNSIGGIGDFGVVTYPEFSSVISLPPDARSVINSIHRGMYDGEWLREFGSSGGHTLDWYGKCGALGAVTPAVDRHVLSAELGERWLYYRFPSPDHISQGNAAGNSYAEDPQEQKSALADAMQDLFSECGIRLGESPRELRQDEKIHMSYTVRAACLLRGTVARDSYHRDIIDLPQTEGPGRMFHSLSALYVAFEKLGLRPTWCWKLVRKIAFDSAPGLRTQIIRHCTQLQTAGKPICVKELQPIISAGPSLLNRVLEDCRLLGILTHNGDEQWYVDKDVMKVFRQIGDDQ